MTNGNEHPGFDLLHHIIPTIHFTYRSSNNNNKKLLPQMFLVHILLTEPELFCPAEYYTVIK